MSRQLLLPELAESVVEGEILNWLVGEGERVELEQPICEVMTDKVTVELPSPYAGILERQLAKVGEVVAVHAPIALFSDSAEAQATQGASSGGGESAPVAGPAGGSPGPARAAPLPAGPDEPDTSLFRVTPHQEQLSVPKLSAGLRGGTAILPAPARTQEQEIPADLTQATHPPVPAARVLAVPAARQLARELGLDISQIGGSGPNGRVRPLDVHQHARQQGTGQQGVGEPGAVSPPPLSPARPGPVAQSPAALSMAAQTGLSVQPVQYRSPGGYEHLETRVPLRGMRRAISTQMQASHLYTVRALTVDEANLSALVQLRGRLNAQLAAGGQHSSVQKLSYLPFIFKAVVAALKKYPSLNTSFDEASGEIVQKGYYHLGMAVTTDSGLTVPVIRDVGGLSLLELGQQVSALAEKARNNKLGAEELAGSSFSVTNIGSVGALFSFPIINVPDAAILGVHSIVRRPIVTAAGEIVAADMMYLSLSFDHRLVDGAEAARFCKEIIRLLENPELLMISM